MVDAVPDGVGEDVVAAETVAVVEDAPLQANAVMEIGSMSSLAPLILLYFTTLLS